MPRVMLLIPSASYRAPDFMEAAARLVSQVGLAVRLTAGITIAVGALVLAGAVAAGHRRRVYDAVVLKVLGATRREVGMAFLIEYGMIGLLAAIMAAAIGTTAAWALVTRTMGMEWYFLPGTVATTAALGVILTMALGFAGTFRALGQKAAPMLRNP